MGRAGKITKSQETMELAMAHYPHFRRYIDDFVKHNPTPKYLTKLEYSLKREEHPNIIYPVGEPMFIHIYKPEGEPTQYIVIEPEMDEETEKLNETILDRMVEIAHRLPVPEKEKDITPVLIKILNEIVIVGERTAGNIVKAKMNHKILLTQEQYDIIKYYLLRNRIGYSKLEPIFNDPYIEDIHCTGVGKIKLVHKIFEMLRCNLEFKDDLSVNKYILETSERVERPVSDSHPVVDAVMPDGSRVNFIYGREISREGSSFTIRKFSEVPVSIIEIINFETMNPEIAAYLWLCLENGMNIFVCGETASGKTTTLNASAAFIKPDDKVYTVENTAEVTMPQDTWQHLVTRESGKDTDVSMFDLLIAALRSRPNYIIVGEIRGEEGNIAFQAMQCIREGHVVIPGRGLIPIEQLYKDMAEKKPVKRLEGKTRIECSNEQIPVYVSHKDERPRRSTITNVYKIDEQELVKVHLDTGETLEVTPNHKFLLPGGQEMTAKELLRHQRKPTLALPRTPSWPATGPTLHDFLIGKNVRKDSLIRKAITHVKQERPDRYQELAKGHQDYLKTRSDTIPYEIYKKLLEEAGCPHPQTVKLVRKGTKNSIRVPRHPTSALLKAVARHIIGKTVAASHRQLIKHVLGITKDNLGPHLFTLGKPHLKIVFEELQTLSETRQRAVNSKLWYSIGRLAGDDSLYLSANKGRCKDYRWQIKNANEDEGVTYAETAKKTIPHHARQVTTTQQDKTYTTRICNVDRSFIDWLTKEGFIWTEETEGYSRAVSKRIPIASIADKHAYVAGLLDSDCTIRHNKRNRTHEIYLALNINRDHEQLLYDQLSLAKEYEHQLFPKIRAVEFRYHKRYEQHVKRYQRYCTEIGLKTRTKRYDKAEGIGARIEFSSDATQPVFARWNKHVAPHMYRQDKKATIRALAKGAEQASPIRTWESHYPEYASQAPKKLMPQLALLGRIFGHTLITESHHERNELRFTYEKRNATEVLKTRPGSKDHTYDISMQDGKYYLGGNHTMGYIYDTGHPVMSTFHAGSVHSMIQRLTGHPIDVPIAFIDNLNIVLIQQAVSVGGRFVRRIMSVSEIERYYDVENKVISRRVFNWDPYKDEHRFSGYYNSFILEKKIAPKIGMAEPKEIYEELALRARVLKKMHELHIFNYYEVYKIIKAFYTEGVEGLPFEV
ncbi:MAG: ATPase, T2SS/T4P/T4SS family [Candidatus Woesearchaeota archaeon]